MNIKSIISITLLFLLCHTGCDIGWKKADGQEEQSVSINVSVSTAQKRDLEAGVEFTGVLEPYKVADLAPLSPGKIKELRVEVGDRVSKGAVLAKMDDVTLVTTTAQFQPLKAQYDRAHRLYAEKAITKAQYEELEAQYLATKRQLDQIEENTTLRATFTGFITAVTAEEGEIFSMGMGLPGQSNGLIQLTRLDPLKIDIHVDEFTIDQLDKNEHVSVHVDAFPDTAFIGTVEWINPSANSVSRAFGVRIIVDNPGNRLKAGYFCRVFIETEVRKQVLSVPVTALVGDRIFVVEKSAAFARPVTIGMKTEQYFEVLSGISEGDLIVVSGNRALPDSAQVETTAQE